MLKGRYKKYMGGSVALLIDLGRLGTGMGHRLKYRFSKSACR